MTSLQQQGQSERGAPSRANSKRKRGSLVASRAFAPLLGLWGAVLGGLTVAVLPEPLIVSATRGLMIGNLGLPVQPAVAVFAALALGGVIFLVAAVMNARARRHSGQPWVVKRAMREMRPIDPARDLGSRSLDEPIDDMPFAAPAWRDADTDLAAEPVPSPEPEVAIAAPRELDLAQFAECPGRNAVWVEEQPKVVAAEVPATASEPVPEPEHPPVTGLRAVPRTGAPAPEPAPHPGTAALSLLRAVPTSELSLPQMVERFAGALHEHRVNPQAQALTAADLAARDAALAEAIKALAALSGDDGLSAARDPLRAALAQLQTSRSAARGAA